MSWFTPFGEQILILSDGESRWRGSSLFDDGDGNWAEMAGGNCMPVTGAGVS
jgi:hypothetical protein